MIVIIESSSATLKYGRSTSFNYVNNIMICLPADTPLPVKAGVFIYPTLIKPLGDCLVFRSGLTLLNNGCPLGKAYGSGILIHFMLP